MSKNKAWLALPALSALALVPLETNADESTISKTAPPMEEILVTARKRLESLQDIPVAITAFNEATLQRRDLRSLDELAGDTAGLVFENYSTSGLSAAPVIRGMALTFATAREQNTSVFLDGIYLQRQSMMNPGLHEMERVEVVKGPQSALYGRNAFAGAINYVTKKPSHEWSGSFGITSGSGDREDFSAAVSGPIVGDKLLARVAYSASEFDGHTRNDHPFADLEPSGERTTGDLGGWEDRMMSVALSFDVNHQLRIGLSYFNNESKREPQPFYNLDGARQVDNQNPENTLNCLNTTTATRMGPIVTPVSGFHAYCGEFDYRPPYRNDLAEQGFFRQVLVDPRSFAVHSETDLWVARLEWDIDDAMSFSYLFGYTDHIGAGTGVQADFKSTQGDNIFPLNTPTTVFNSNPEEILEADSHELQLSWENGSSLQLRGGLYYSSVEDSSWNTFWFIAPCNSEENCRDGVTTSDPVLLSLMPPGSGHGKKSNLKHYNDKIYAVFSEISYDLTDRLSATIEARYTREDKKFFQETSSFGAPEALRGKEQFNYFTPRFTLQYNYWNHSLLYANYGKGVKTGGFNTIDPDINPDQATYDEEENWSLEIGSKNTLLDGSWQLNIAAFHIEWHDQQGTESANDPEPFASDVLGNIGDAEVYGIEIETTYFLTQRWFVDGSYTYNNPTFKNAVYSPAVNDTNSSYGCDDVTCPSNGDVSGNMLQRASKQQSSLGLNYKGDIGGWLINGRLSANYRSRMYATPLNLAHNGSRTIANLALGVSRGPWDINLWGKNIFDEKYVANTFVLPSFSGYLVTLGPRATWGMGVRYSF